MKQVLVILMLVAACGGGGSGDDDVAPDANVSAPDAAAPDAYIPATCDTADGFTFYLNNAGGDFVMGAADDPATNTSQILDTNQTLAPWGTDNFAEIVACIRQGMAEYNVQIVETEPAAAPYTEVVFTETQVFQQGVVSVAPSTCTPLESHITFMFGSEVADDPAAACQYALFTMGVVTTLDTSMNNCDWMTFGSGCTTGMRFVDSDEMCGDFTAHNCRCTGSPTQNTHDIVHAAYGGCPPP